MEKRHSIDEEVYNFVISKFDKNYTEKYSSYKSTSKDFELTIYISDIKREGKISVNISKIINPEKNYRKNVSYEFSYKTSKLLRNYFEDKIDSLNQDYIRNKNEDILKLIK